jgi:hypothetical protein
LAKKGVPFSAPAAKRVFLKSESWLLIAFQTTQEVAMLPESMEIKIKLKGLQDRLETLRGHL